MKQRLKGRLEQQRYTPLEIEAEDACKVRTIDTQAISLNQRNRLVKAWLARFDGGSGDERDCLPGR